MTIYLARSVMDPDQWLNGEGYWGELEHAAVFTEAEKEAANPLYSGEWVKFAEVPF